VRIVTFAGSAQLAHQAGDRPPFAHRRDRRHPDADGSAIGGAIVLCLAELFPRHGIDLGEMIFGP
jgi:Ca-activated chloride channel family protein